MSGIEVIGTGPNKQVVRFGKKVQYSATDPNDPHKEILKEKHNANKGGRVNTR